MPHLKAFPISQASHFNRYKTKKTEHTTVVTGSTQLTFVYLYHNWMSHLKIQTEQVQKQLIKKFII
jgi:hypothetical protein